jgi:hypothetical protein
VRRFPGPIDALNKVGLGDATVLTLVVVATLYAILFRVRT